MFNVCILSIDYNKNTQNSKKKLNVTFFKTPPKKNSEYATGCRCRITTWVGRLSRYVKTNLFCE
jgi:hypothetical protein